jgi:hypothetical protein
MAVNHHPNKRSPHYCRPQDSWSGLLAIYDLMDFISIVFAPNWRALTTSPVAVDQQRTLSYSKFQFNQILDLFNSRFCFKGSKKNFQAPTFKQTRQSEILFRLNILKINDCLTHCILKITPTTKSEFSFQTNQLRYEPAIKSGNSNRQYRRCFYAQILKLHIITTIRYPLWP